MAGRKPEGVPEGSRRGGGRGAMGIGARGMFGWVIGRGWCDGPGAGGDAPLRAPGQSSQSWGVD